VPMLTLPAPDSRRPPPHSETLDEGVRQLAREPHGAAETTNRTESSTAADRAAG
jgi:hypothetical protein